MVFLRHDVPTRHEVPLRRRETLKGKMLLPLLPVRVPTLSSLKIGVSPKKFLKPRVAMLPAEPIRLSGNLRTWAMPWH